MHLKYGYFFVVLQPCPWLVSAVSCCWRPAEPCKWGQTLCLWPSVAQEMSSHGNYTSKADDVEGCTHGGCWDSEGPGLSGLCRDGAAGLMWGGCNPPTLRACMQQVLASCTEPVFFPSCTIANIKWSVQQVLASWCMESAGFFFCIITYHKPEIILQFSSSIDWLSVKLSICFWVVLRFMSDYN